MKIGGEKMIELIALVLACVLMASFGQIYMKKGLKEKPLDLKEILSTKIFSTVFEPNVFLGLTLYVISAIVWLTILSKADVSYVYPMIALGYIVTAFLARLYFNESITTLRWIGMLLILGGVFLIAKS
jgi:drug/metabolite transporter (DMT)-like permease